MKPRGLDVLIAEIDRQHLWERDIRLKRNEFVATPGDLNTHLYVVVSGALRMYIMDDGVEHVVRFGYPLNLVGVLDCLMTGRPTQFYMQAIKKTELKAISQQAFERLIRSTPEMRTQYEAILKNLVHQQMEREMDLLTASPQARYRRVLARSPQLFNEVPHRHIASYLRMTPETLSRVKREVE
ncbi:Crp/Fnr family transcriptional regulator [Roseivirga sp. BDSF3-8]|uniref:Crp/Fnr family transcriptional regulator n=1 Tax=Roseivirga sp. BDSF3-8 TaxID=3241598 RepID=UPI003531F8CD